MQYIHERKKHFPHWLLLIIVRHELLHDSTASMIIHSSEIHSWHEHLTDSYSYMYMFLVHVHDPSTACINTANTSETEDTSISLQQPSTYITTYFFQFCHTVAFGSCG